MIKFQLINMWFLEDGSPLFSKWAVMLGGADYRIDKPYNEIIEFNLPEGDYSPFILQNNTESDGYWFEFGTLHFKPGYTYIYDFAANQNGVTDHFLTEVPPNGPPPEKRPNWILPLIVAGIVAIPVIGLIKRRKK